MPKAEAAVRPDGSDSSSSSIRYAVLCSTTDPSGPWAEAALQRRGLPGVRLVTADEIVYSTRFVHRQLSGRVSTEITLPDGAVLGPDLRGVLNRVMALPSDHLARSQEQERDYAVQEIHALLTSVLASLPGVVNPAGPRGLPGPWLSEAEWLCAAARSGLAGVGFRSTRPPSELVGGDRSMLVIGSQVLPAGGVAFSVPEPIAHGCRALAARVGARLLGVDFRGGEDKWLFVGAHPTPDLRWGGPQVEHAVVQLLASGSSS